MENQKALLDDISQHLGVKGGDLSPWYKLDLKSVIKMGGGGLLRHYDNSLYNMLRHVYHDYDWLPWKFKKLGNIAIRSPDALRKVMRFIESELKISKDEDWYLVSQSKLDQLGVLKTVSQLGGLHACLREYKSDVEWDAERLSASKNFGGRVLRSSVRTIWPFKDIDEDYELDPYHKVSVLLPHMGLALDYQSVDYYGLSGQVGNISVALREHPEKVALASSQGITIVFVPFWWDRKIPSLLATILHADEKYSDFIEDNAMLKKAKKAQRIPEQTIVKLASNSRGKKS